MIFPLVGFLTKNQNSELITKVKIHLEEYDIKYDIYDNAQDCFDRTDFDKPPRIVLIDNEKEWRRYMVKKVDRNEQEMCKIKNDLSSIKSWMWVGRGLILSAFGGLVAWIKSSLGAN